MPDPASITEGLGGVATREQLLARGLTGFDLTRAVRLGALVRVRRAHYATPDATADQRTAVRVGGRLGCLSAAASFGLWGGADIRVHVAVARNASRLRTNRSLSAPRTPLPLEADAIRRPIVLHWCGSIETPLECWRVSLGDCLRQVVRCAGRELAGAVLDSALSTGQLDRASLCELFADAFTRERLLAGGATPRSESGTESRVARRLTALGISYRQQVRIPRVGRVDFLLPKRVIVEVDGYAYHSSPDRFEEDRRRDAVAASLGYLVLRFSYAQVMNDVGLVERTILGALAAR